VICIGGGVCRTYFLANDTPFLTELYAGPQASAGFPLIESKGDFRRVRSVFKLLAGLGRLAAMVKPYSLDLRERVVAAI
jgi:hypothetical protein